MRSLKNIFRRFFFGCLMISVNWVQAQDREKREPEKIIFRGVTIDSVEQALRDPRVGCIFLASEPSTVDILGVEGDRIVFRENTPAFLCDLDAKKYQIVFTKHGFEKYVVTVRPIPGRVDTLFVTLKSGMMSVQPKSGRGDTLAVTLEPRIFQKPRHSKWLRWVWSGIAGAGVIAVAAIVLFPPDRDSGKNTIPELPVPPDRP
jgi:hypothetical protein